MIPGRVYLPSPREARIASRPGGHRFETALSNGPHRGRRREEFDQAPRRLGIPSGGPNACRKHRDPLRLTRKWPNEVNPGLGK
jgi:hypothetical protein